MSNTSRFVMIQGPEPGQTFVLEQDKVEIGRDPRNEIVIGDPQVSRRHARITRRGDLWVIEDLGSTNGTFVNGMELTRPHTLANGDQVSVGGSVTLTYHGRGAETPSAEAEREPAVYKPTPPSSAPEEPARPESPDTHAADEPPRVEPVGEAEEEPEFMEEGRGSRKTLTWIAIGCLVLLILACIAIVIFLWNAPASFWEMLMGWGLPIPTLP